MTQLNLKSAAIAAVMIVTTAIATSAGNMFWVVGNLVTNSCDIVSQNPVVSPDGPVWFGNGPHKTYDDAKQARSGISACPKVD